MAYNTIVQIVGKVITTLISLVLVASLTRHLGVSGYGEYTTIFAYIAFFGVFADFGFFWIFVREIAKPSADIDKATSNILTLRTVVGIIVFGLGALVGLFVPQYAGFHAGIAIVALASLFQAMNSTYVGVFQNKLRMDKSAITDVIGRVIILGLTLYLIKMNYGLNSILWAYAAGNIVNFFASAYFGKIYVHFRPAFDFVYWRELFWEALPMGIILILGLISFKIDSVMLSLMRTSTDIGIYGPPYKVLEIFLLLPSIFLGNIFPIIVRYIHENDARLNSVLQKSFEFLTILAWPLAVGTIFTATRIIRIVAGQEFVTAHTIGPVFGLPATSPTALQILVCAVGISFIANIFGYLVIALGKQSKMIGPYICFVVFNVVMNLILIPHYSYIGAAFVTFLTELLGLILSWRVAHKYLPFKLDLNILWKVLFACVFMGVFLHFTAQNLNIVILMVLSAIVYGVSLYAVGGINREMFLSLMPSKKTPEGLK